MTDFPTVEATDAHLRALDATASIISTALHNRALDLKDVPTHVPAIFSALLTAVTGGAVEPEPEKLTPPIPIKKTVTPDHIISLEDGKPYKSLKRHLSTRGLTPEAYRSKWGLPIDYPMVASNYAAQRSELAKSIGLGRKGTAGGDPPEA